MKYKKSLLTKINAPLEEIEFEISELDKGKRERLLREYTLAEPKTEPITDPLSEKEKANNAYLVKKIERNIEFRRKGCIKTIKIQKTLFEIFEGYTKEEILLAISTLDYYSINLLKIKYGENYDNKFFYDTFTQHERNYLAQNVIRKLKLRLQKLRQGYIVVGIEDIFPGINLNDLKNVINSLNKRDKKNLYNKFETDLEGKTLIKKDDDNFLKDLKLKIYLKLGIKEKIRTDYIPFINVYIEYKKEDETIEEFEKRLIAIVNGLDEEERKLLYKKYGNDLKNTKNRYLTENESYKISMLIKNKIINILKRQNGDLRRKCDLLINYFEPFASFEEVVNEINILPEKDKVLLQKKYGIHYNSITYLEDLTTEEHNRIKCIKTKLFIRILKKSKEKSQISLPILKYIRELSKTNEYYWLRERIGANKAIAVLIKKYLEDSCTLSQISALTNENAYDVIMFTKEFLYYQKEYFKRKNKKDKITLIYENK